MPVMKRITQEQAQSARKFDAGQRLTDDDLDISIKDIWINRSGVMFYAGYYEHEKSAKVLGYKNVTACEVAGYAHISSCFLGSPQLVNKDTTKFTSAQRDTIAYFFAIHSMQNPLD